MSRYHFYGRSRDTYGNVVSNVNVSVYLAGTTTPAAIFESRTGGTAISAAPQVTTDSNGLFDLWVDDTIHPKSTLFDIVVGSITYSEFDIFRETDNITDHGNLTGLSDDDHTQYVLVDGSRRFTSPVSGQTPTLGNHLVTKTYADSLSGVGDHGSLTGLNDDDHTQYILVDGTRAFTGSVTIQTGDFLLTDTTPSAGIIYKGSDRFIHSYSHANNDGYNVFVGQNAGNFTMYSAISSQSSYNTGLGANVLDSLTTGFNNVGIGYNVLTNTTTGPRNVAIGHSSMLSNTNGYDNVAAGFESLRSNQGGSANISIGNYSLRSNTGGFSNVAVGQSSLYFNVNGYYNTAIGFGALEDNTANFNTGVGKNAGNANTSGLSNVCVGVDTLLYSKTGGYNVILGTSAGEGTLNSSNISRNVLIGFESGHDLLTNGDNNILIGYRAGDKITTGSNNILIGYDIDTVNITDSNFLNIGDTIYGDLSSGYIGIGTTAPSSTLDVKGDVTTQNVIPSADATYTLGTSANRWSALHLSSKIYYDSTLEFESDSGEVRDMEELSPVLYGTSATPPSSAGYPNGTLYFQYTT